MRLILRAFDGCSPAALRLLIKRGPKAGRKIVGATLRQAVCLETKYLMNWLDLLTIFSVDEDLVLSGESWCEGSTSPLERVLLAQLIRFFKPKTILELGTYRGSTTRLLLDNMPPDGTIYTVDLPPEGDFSNIPGVTDMQMIALRAPSQGYEKHARARNVKQVLGNTFDPSLWARIPEGIEFAFIDASHSYEAVKNDTEWVHRKAVKDAVLVWHDYMANAAPENGVGRFIREQMRDYNDIFVCSDTTMAIRIPTRFLGDGTRCT